MQQINNQLNLNIMYTKLTRKITVLFAGLLLCSFQAFSQNLPYNVVMNIYDDPATTMAFNWFTSADITSGEVQIVQGTVGVSAFGTPDMFFPATRTDVTDWNYYVAENELTDLTGIPTSISCNIYKAVATGLLESTTYSFRVGSAGAWSEIGTFTTSGNNKNPFSFVYTTDSRSLTSEDFGKTQLATHAAFAKDPSAAFWLHGGNIVASSSYNNEDLSSEWEWDQFFDTQQDLLYKYPFAPVMGNRDQGYINLPVDNVKFGTHFNIKDENYIDNPWKSVYSFVYGDALFLAINSERYGDDPFIEDLKAWMADKVNDADQLNIKWRIVYFHKAIYSGAFHQTNVAAKAWRDILAPTLDELGIDLVLQGYDQSYSVIGPVKNKQLVPDAASNQLTVATADPGNLTGKLGGIYNTQEGTLYFINSSSGTNKNDPNPLSSMSEEDFVSSTGLANYSTLFTGRFGNTDNPTFSNITVSTDNILINTWEMKDGNPVEFDQIKVVKSPPLNVTVIADPVAGGTVAGGVTGIAYGKSITVTAAPATSHNFVNWTNGSTVVSTNTSYSFMATETVTLTANFVIKTYPITASVNGANGTISPVGTTNVNHGESQTYTITPDAGYYTDQVLIDGTDNPATVNSDTYTFTNVIENHTIEVSFKKYISVTTSANLPAAGDVSSGGTYRLGADVIVTAIPNTGYDFVNWTDENDAEVSTDTEYTFTATEDVDLTANFVIKTYPVTALVTGGNGTITPSGITDIDHDGSQTYTFNPNTGYHIAIVLVDGVNNPGAVSSGTYTFTSVTEPHTIVVAFEGSTYDITALVIGGNGTVTPDGITTVDHGESQTYTITPDAGYHIAQILVDGVNNPAAVSSGTYTFTNVTANHTIDVSFVKITVSPETLLLIIGESAPLTATITSVGDINLDVSWSSDQPEIATVDDNGLVTGVSEGTATITVTMAYLGLTAECMVTVLSNDASIVGIWVNDEPSVLSSEDDTIFEITVDFIANITITASANHQAATIDEDCLGTKPVQTGKNIFEIVVTAEDGSTKEYTLEVTVNGLVNSDITLENNKITVYPNPASEIIVIKDLEGHGILTIFDATGRQMMKREITSPMEIISVNTLPEGIYFVQIVEGERVKVIKIVILRA